MPCGLFVSCQMGVGTDRRLPCCNRRRNYTVRSIAQQRPSCALHIMHFFSPDTITAQTLPNIHHMRHHLAEMHSCISLSWALLTWPAWPNHLFCKSSAIVKRVGCHITRLLYHDVLGLLPSFDRGTYLYLLLCISPVRLATSRPKSVEICVSHIRLGPIPIWRGGIFALSLTIRMQSTSNESVASTYDLSTLV